MSVVSLITWEDHFVKHMMSCPKESLLRPCMYEGKPFWFGGIANANNRDPEVYEPIIDFYFEMYLVPYKGIRTPSDVEYKKYFKQAVEKHLYVVNGSGRVRKPQNVLEKQKVSK